MDNEPTVLDVPPKPLVLKVLLQQRHLQSHRAFCREYDKIAERVDRALKGGWPSKAQFYRWLSGNLIGLPYPDHCRILEAMFPGWKADQLFQEQNGALDFASGQGTPQTEPKQQGDRQAAAREAARVFPHRNAVPVELWDRLIRDATETIEILVHAALFLVERPRFIKDLTSKAKAGAKIRIAFGDPEGDSIALRSEEEQLGDGTLSARIRNALAFYRPLVGVDGIEMRFHNTTLYNSIFRFDDEMIINTHVYGYQGAHAPSLHVSKTSAGDLFETYSGSFEAVWNLAEPATF